MFALDLDEVPALARRLPFFSLGRPNLYSFREGDYLPLHEAGHNPSGPAVQPASSAGLRARVEALAAAQRAFGEALVTVHGTLDARQREALAALAKPRDFEFAEDEAGGFGLGLHHRACTAPTGVDLCFHHHDRRAELFGCFLRIGGG